MKEFLLLFIGSALFSMGLRVLLRKNPAGNSGETPASRVPEDQKTCYSSIKELFCPSCSVDCRIPLKDLFEVRPQRGHQPLFKLIDGLHLDFLLADSATGMPLCGISLDDHLPSTPLIERLFSSQGLLLLRMPRWQLADADTLHAAIARLNRPAPRHSPPRSGARD